MKFLGVLTVVLVLSYFLYWEPKETRYINCVKTWVNVYYPNTSALMGMCKQLK